MRNFQHACIVIVMIQMVERDTVIVSTVKKFVSIVLVNGVGAVDELATLNRFGKLSSL